MSDYRIRDLALVSDRNTAAVIDKRGDICWYCPGQFDNPSFFASLLGDETKGVWKLDFPDEVKVERRYLGNSSILQSSFFLGNEKLVLTDWMPVDDEFSGICRSFSPCSWAIKNIIIPAPGYGKDNVEIKIIDKNISGVNDSIFIVFSHPYEILNNKIIFNVPPRQEAWVLLSERIPGIISDTHLKKSFSKTRDSWERINKDFSYEGFYKKEILDSLRAIQQLTHEPSGGIIAAATTSLPEVIGGQRNYDYRFVWLRDASMIVSAITRAGSMKDDAIRFLDFICSARKNINDYSTAPFLTLDKRAAPSEKYLDLDGYRNSKPVRIGNNANEQLQLDAGGNILLAAKLIYGKYNAVYHWQTIEEIADFITSNWHREDNGIWEENISRHFTSSKVIMAVALEYISHYSTKGEKKKSWLQAAENIRDFIDNHCHTSSGSYSVFSGSNQVDITAVLFPEWGFCKADTPAMEKTVEELEARYCKNNLVYRNLILYDSRKEGAFLAASFWMAQYWIMRDEYQKSKLYIDTALKYSNDLGLFSEEADPNSDIMLGNFPQSFVHASFIGAAIDFNNAFGSKESE